MQGHRRCCCYGYYEVCIWKNARAEYIKTSPLLGPQNNCSILRFILQYGFNRNLKYILPIISQYRETPELFFQPPAAYYEKSRVLEHVRY